ncbi:hypothetical protein AAGF08_20130, partial [Algoriphagus sp. SE2]|uniref:hypothetical protein n=1 Tax=Algoriphagus sp. SE2 TaxID=3141536 RepID=UPI0031CCF7DB
KLKIMTINTTQWPTLYSDANVKKWGLPCHKNISPQKGIFQNLYLKWSDLPEFTDNEDEVDLYYICCDVLDLDEMVDVLTGTFIFARRIQVGKDCGFIIQASDFPSPFLCVTQEIVDKTTGESIKLPITAVIDDGMVQKNFDFTVNEHQQRVNVFEWEEGASNKKTYLSYKLDPGYFIEGEPIRIYLRTIFQLATLLFADSPEISLRQLDYIAALAEASDDTRSVCGEARALATTLRSILAAPKNALLVPQLDHNVYADKAKACFDLLKLRQANWDAMQNNINNTEKWLESAKDALKISQSEQNLNKLLLQQAKDTRQQVLNARTIAARQIVASQIQLIWKQNEFVAGVKNWEIDETIKAVFNLVSGVVKILSQIPAIVATGPTLAVMPAIQTATSLASLGAKALGAVGSKLKPNPYGFIEDLDLGNLLDDGAINNDDGGGNDLDEDDFQNVSSDELDKLAAKQKAVDGEREKAQNELVSAVKGVAEGGKEVADAVMRIMDVAKQADQMESGSQQALLTTNASVSAVFSSNSVEGIDVVSGGSQEWDNLSLALDNFFKKVPDGISEKGPYQMELQRLIIIGKVYSEARLALAKANAQLAEMLMRKETADKSVKIYQDRVNKLGSEIVKDATILQLSYGKILDSKRAIYLAMEAYRRAFIYYTLVNDREAPELPKLTDSVDQFASTVSKISGKLLDLTSLSKEPEGISPTYTIPIEDLESSLKENGIFSYNFTPENPAFERTYRIRLDNVQVFLEGLEIPEEVIVSIVTSGGFNDKTANNGIRQFVSQPIRRLFKYDGATKKPTMTGGIVPRYLNDFFKPTPFTTWTIEITGRGNKKFDLSNVTGVTFSFVGEATAI